MGTVTRVGSVLAPVVDNRFVPIPHIMMFAVTRRCNSRCRMCNIWQETEAPDPSLREIERLLAENDFSSMRSLTLTGGEPVLRVELPQIFEAALEAMPRLEHILLATNGLATRRTVEQVRQMLEALAARRHRVRRFDVQISLDGLGQVHDAIRGVAGAFDRVQDTLDRLQALEGRFPLLRRRLSCVLLPDNLPHVDALHDYARRQGMQIHYSPAVVSGEYYGNVDGGEGLLLTGEHREAARKFFERLSREDQTSLRFYYQDMAGMMEGRPRGRRCMMGFYGFVLEHDGRVYPCVNCERRPFGDLRSESFEEAWFGPQANEARRELRQRCCPTCTSMCYTQAVNLWEMVETSWRRWRGRIGARLAGQAK
jgi:radical SAM protein with 4Fe4S-binding SPASM domain